MSYRPIPIRLRSKVGQVSEANDSHKQWLGAWVFTVWLTNIDGSGEEELGTYGPFRSKDDAEKACRITTVEMANTVSEIAGGKENASKLIYDMNKGGKLRNPIDFIERG